MGFFFFVKPAATVYLVLISTGVETRAAGETCGAQQKSLSEERALGGGGSWGGAHHGVVHHGGGRGEGDGGSHDDMEERHGI